MTQPPQGWSTPGQPPAESPPPPPPPGYGPPPPPPYYGQPGWAQPQWGAPVVTPGVVPLRPLTLGELLDGAVKVIRRYPRPTLGLSALIAIVTTLINVLLVLSRDYSGAFDDLESGSSSSSGPSIADAGSILSAVLGLFFGIILTGFLVVVVGKAVRGQSTSFGEAWTQVRPRVWALLGVALLTGLLASVPIAVGVLLAWLLVAAGGPVTLVFGIPLAATGAAAGVYLYVRVSLAPAALVLEKAGVRKAMERSGVLVKDDWWRLFGILLLTWFLSYVVSNVLVLPFAAIGFVAVFAGGDPSAGDVTLLFVLVQVGSGVASFLIAPFGAGVRSLLYVDRRMRAEGLDLTLQAAARG